MKIKHLIVVLLVSTLFIVACSEQELQQVTKELEQVTEEVEKVTETKTEEKVEIKTEEKPEQKTTELSKIGDDIRVDYLTYKVVKVETYTSIGTALLGKETQGLFYKVYLTITNNAKESKNIFTPRFKIIDDEGYSYDSDIEAEIYIDDTIRFGEQLQPRLAISGAKIFEVPKIAKNLKLEISGDWLSTDKVVVELDKIIAKGKETSMQDKIDDQLDEYKEQAQKNTDELMKQLDKLNEII